MLRKEFWQQLRYTVAVCLQQAALVPSQSGAGLLRGRRQRQRRARVDEPREAHARDVARLRVDAMEVPDGLGGLREVVRQEAAWPQGSGIGLGLTWLAQIALVASGKWSVRKPPGHRGQG